jgi:hypothetical protein
LYGAGLWAVAALDGQLLGQAACFSPWTLAPWTTARLAAAVAMAGGGVLTVLVIPWLLALCAWQRFGGRGDTAGAWSLAVNCVALVLACLLLRQSVGIARGSFLAVWLAWSAALLCMAGGPASAWMALGPLARRWRSGLAIGVLAVLVGMALFGRQQFGQCFEGDGTEVFELARSLRHHFLPYWEIDAVERFGNVVVYPAMIDSYWTLAVQLVLGESEASTRLVYWMWWLGIFLAALRMSQTVSGTLRVPTADGTRNVPDTLCLIQWRPAVPLALSMLLISLWYTFYTGYYPYMTDLASPGVPDAMLTLLVLLALDCFRLGDLRAWAVMLAICSLTSYAAPVMLLLTTVAALVWRPLPRKRLLGAALGAGLLLGAIALGYAAWGCHNGWLWFGAAPPGAAAPDVEAATWLDKLPIGGAWWQTLVHESFEGYYLPVRDSASAWAFAGYFVLGSGGLLTLGLLRPFLSKDRQERTSEEDSPIFVGRKAGQSAGEIAWRRTVATVALGYLAIILHARCKNLHYLGPLLMFAPILWLRATGGCSLRQPSDAGTTRPLLRRLATAFPPGIVLATVSVLACIGLCWPRAWPQFTLNQQLGALTTFQTDSYEDAVRMAKIVYPAQQQGLISWELGPHNWVLYSERAAHPVRGRPLLVSAQSPPGPEYHLLLQWNEVKLYCRDAWCRQWLRERHPPSGADRVPWALRSTAIAPKTPD